MKKYILILVFFFLASVCHGNPEYDKNMEIAYNYYLKYDFKQAIEFYRRAIKDIYGLLPEDLSNADSSVFKISVVPEKRWITAVSGIQSCLIGSALYYDTVVLGERILRLTGYCQPVLLNNGYCYSVMKDYVNTVKTYTLVFEKDSRNLAAIKGLFWANYYMGNVEDTLKFLQYSVSLDKSDQAINQVKGYIEKSDYYLTLNAAYYNYIRENVDLAHRLYEKSLDLAQDLDDAQRLEAAVGIQNCLVKKKVYDKAIIVGENILFEHPENSFAILNVAFCYYTSGQYDKAAVYYNNLHRLYPERSDALIGLSWCHYHTHDFRKSVRFMKAARRLVKDKKIIKELEDKLYNTSLDRRFKDYFQAGWQD